MRKKQVITDNTLTELKKLLTLGYYLKEACILLNLKFSAAVNYFAKHKIKISNFIAISRECPLCKTRKDISKFKTKNGVSFKRHCDICTKCKEKKWTLFASSRIQSSIEDIVNIFNQNNGLCDICGLDPKQHDKTFCLDHDHKTLKLRGVLCQRCNCGLGRFKDNPELLRNAINYLTKFKNKDLTDA